MTAGGVKHYALYVHNGSVLDIDDEQVESKRVSNGERRASSDKFKCAKAYS